MFSPRNIVKFLSRNIEDFRKEHNTTVTKFNEDDINKEFHRFLNSISK